MAFPARVTSGLMAVTATTRVESVAVLVSVVLEVKVAVGVTVGESVGTSVMVGVVGVGVNVIASSGWARLSQRPRPPPSTLTMTAAPMKSSARRVI